MWLCYNSVGQTDSRDLSKFPNPTAKTQRTFPLLQKICLCECKHNSMDAQDLPAPACFPVIQKKTALAALDKERVSFPLVDAATSRMCTLVLLFLRFLSIRQWECLLLSALCHCQFFCCLYLPTLSTIQTVEPYFFFPSSSVYCLQIKFFCRDDSVLSHISHLLHTLHLSLKHQALPFLNTSALLSPPAAISHHSSSISP